MTISILPLLLATLASPGPSLRAYEFGMLSDTRWSSPDYYAEGRDVNLQNERRRKWLVHETANLARAAATCAAEPAAEFVVHTGDLVDGSCGSLERQYRQLVDGWRLTREAFPENLPFLAVIGNREAYEQDEPGTYAYTAYELTVQRYVADELGEIFPVGRHYAFAYGPDLFIAYNSNVDEYEFFRETLAAHPSVRYVFAIGHIPVVNPCAGGVEIDALMDGKKPVEKDNRFLRLLQSRNVILLCGDTQRLGLVDYVTKEGRLTELMGSSVFDNPPYREIAQAPADFPISLNSAWQPGGTLTPRQRFLKAGVTRFWGAVGAGFWKLRVSDEAVAADLYAWGREGIAKTVVLRQSAEPVKVVKPAEPVKVVKPAAPVKVVKPAAPVKVVKPAEPVKVVKPAEPVKVVKPAEPVKVVKPAEPVKVVKPAVPVKPVGIGRLESDSRAFLLPELTLDGKSVLSDARFCSVPSTCYDDSVLERDGLLEIFFDLKNSRRNQLDEDTVSLVLMRLSDDPAHVRALVRRNAGKKHVWTNLSVVNGRIRVPWIQVAPSNDRQFVPAPGAVIGFDALYAKKPTGNGKCDPANPSTWGTLRRSDK